MIAIVVLVFATILTQLIDHENIQKEEEFVREAFINLWGRENNNSEDNSENAYNESEIPQSLASHYTGDNDTSLRATEIKAIGDRISQNTETIKKATEDFIKREEQKNSELDIETQMGDTAALLTLEHKHHLDTLRYKLTQ